MDFDRAATPLVICDISSQNMFNEKNTARQYCAIYVNNNRTRDLLSVPAEDFMKSTLSEKDKKPWIGRRCWGDIMVFVDVNGGEKAPRKLEDYVAKTFAHQHQTHLYVLYVYRKPARICLFDRSGGVVTGPFPYGKRDNPTV
ncbi:hypothetical protein DICSQDRAFT_180684 [Dichomitus squalens LYAD-421 SS1]|uniref:Uncharacterized protein n=1 Tax=Dichomitus squalens (strain LYAD-421) TaxID=732165 RepID=R7SZL5_DICSQ|nr:uncharacterized protein DICSQDRAFT_180684 [Dichomitus squalens LYAD-421 SS1]EJF61398.1 hypothetical protein DICSQDRAFT_180684 [Dichomitus squalens LYAD-421 SS1]